MNEKQFTEISRREFIRSSAVTAAASAAGIAVAQPSNVITNPDQSATAIDVKPWPWT